MLDDSPYRCGGCGRAVIGEPEDGTTRGPCPHCGSHSRTIALRGHLAARALATAELTVGTYAEVLLETAKSLVAAGQPTIAIVTAHMACEIAAERALARAFAARGLEFLEASVTDLLNGHNMASDRVRGLYTALTGDHIETQPFWGNFVISSKRRNRAIHAGDVLSEAEGRDSVAAATALVDHLQA
jgi:hypothetical protein